MLFLRKELFANASPEDACSDFELRRKVMRVLRFIVRHAAVPRALVKEPGLFPYVLYFATYMEPRLWVRFATAVAKREALHSQPSDWSEFGVVSPSVVKDLDTVFYPCSEDEVLGLSSDCSPVFRYAVKWLDWVRAFCCYNDPNYRLVNQYLVGGYVLLTDEREVRKYIEMRVRNEVLTLMFRAFGFTREESEGLVRLLLAGQVNTVKEALKTPPTPRLTADDCIIVQWAASLKPAPTRVRVVNKASEEGNELQNSLPPCVANVLNEVRGGGNPSHFARFLLASFMLRRCHDVEGRPIEECVEETADLFKTAADYKEKTTRYQVEHIAGLRGGRKFYMPPSCQEIYSNGLCPTNLGCGVKNPLQLIGWRGKISENETV